MSFNGWKVAGKNTSDVFVAVEALNLFQEIRHSLCSLFCPLKRGNNVLRVGPCENPPVYSRPLYVFGAQDTLTAFYNAAQHSLTHAPRRANQKQITLYVCLVAPRGLNSLDLRVRVRAPRRQGSLFDGLLQTPPPPTPPCI